MKKIYSFLLNTLPRPLLIRLSYVFKWFAPYFYYGNNVTCNVCEKSFSKFLSYGTKVSLRDNVLCPHCLSLERHRLMWLYLNNKTDFFSASKKVLHIAPEQCFYDRFKTQKNLDYTTADLFSPLADLKFDLHKIPLEDNLYDVIFCNHVLEHVEDDHQCMKELLRILKPGGWAILQVPLDYSRQLTYEDKSITDPLEREKHYWQKDHLRLYGNDYPEKLRAAGFKVKEENYVKTLSIELIEKHRFASEEVIYVGSK
jgi:SAM-dependent methyltransferase